MGWFRVVDGRLRYRRVTPVPLIEWTSTADGRAAVAAAGRYVRFSLFGRDRTGRARLWRELKDLAVNERVAATINGLAGTYPSLLAGFAFADGLPRATVDLRRLVVVPRALVNAQALATLTERFLDLHVEQGLRAGTQLRDFFVVTLVDEMDRALLAARPTPRRPLPVGEGWVTVGIDPAFVWLKPPWQGPSWAGHHYLYEPPHGGLSRRERRRLESAIRDLAASLGSRSYIERYETLQSARVSLSAAR